MDNPDRSQPPIDHSIIPQSQEEVDNLRFNGVGPNFNPDNSVTLENVAETAYRHAREMLENRQLRYDHERDSRTGMLLKENFLNHVSERLANAQPNQVFALFFYDLDNFKAINEKHPRKYDEGDDVIKDVANLLKLDVRRDPDPLNITSEENEGSSLLARTGGDEFARFSELYPRENPALTPKERLDSFLKRQQSLFDDYLAGKPELVKEGFGISVGSILCRAGDNPQELLAKAALLMVDAKKVHHAQNGSHRS